MHIDVEPRVAVFTLTIKKFASQGGFDSHVEVSRIVSFLRGGTDPTGPAPVVNRFDDYAAGSDARLHRPCAGGERV
jgi:hypothetical protein